MPRGDQPTTKALALKDGWVYEDALPEMTKEQYDWWFNESLVLDGVRMGPPLTTNHHNEQSEAGLLRRTVIRCRPDPDSKWIEYVFPTGQSAAGFWHEWMRLHPKGAARCKGLVSRETGNSGAHQPLWYEPQDVPASVAAPQGDLIEWLRYAKTELECHAAWWSELSEPHFKARARQAQALINDIAVVLAPSPSSPVPPEQKFDWAKWQKQAEKFCNTEVYAPSPSPVPSEWDILALLQSLAATPERPRQVFDAGFAATSTPVEQERLVTENPFEQIVERALLRAGHSYVTDHGGGSPAHLDFYLPAVDVHIEVKTMHSDRVGEQMSRVANVIVAQGRGAIEWLAAQICSPVSAAPASPSPAEGILEGRARAYAEAEAERLARWRERDANAAHGKEDKCAWTLDDSNDGGVWGTGCGETFQFTDGGPTDNKFIFCYRCGKRIDAAGYSDFTSVGEEGK